MAKFLLSDLDESFTDASDGCYLPSDSISRSIRNRNVLQDSRKKPGRMGGVLTWFLMSDLDETFKDASDVFSLQSDTISWSIRNVHVLQDSRKRLGGQVES